MNKRKVVVVDWSIIVFRSIYAWERNRAVPATYTGLSILIGALKKIHINKNDIVIIAVDSIKGNWRKKLVPHYKADRKEKREKHEEIDWDYMFASFNGLLCDLDNATNFHVLEFDGSEADDIGACCAKFYQDKDEISEVVLCSYDEDWQILWYYDKVKIYSFLKKHKSVKGSYKIKPKNFNAYALLAKKINKEASDNLKEEILNERAYDNREKVVNLLDLPTFVEQPIMERLKNLKPKENYNLEILPFDSLRKRFPQIYDSKYKITYEEAKEYQRKRAERKKKKSKKKRKQKKQEVRK